ncbi:MAG: heparinase II/III domain-containing protein, partial [Bdellovibrionales bacterium]
LHPKVRASLVRHGGSALLRLYSGSGWRFEQSGGVLSLEESVYMGGDQEGGVPIKTQQLVLSFDIGANMFGTQVKWAFQREK